MINSFDWIDDLEMRFNAPEYSLIDLKKNKFYGSLEINFEAGIPRTISFKRHIKADNLNERKP